jgi:hypothetical protein
MRYIPKNKISKPFSATLGEFQVAATNLPYVGEVVQVASKKYYAYEQGRINQAKKLLKAIQDPTPTHTYSDDRLPRESLYYSYIARKGKRLSYTNTLPQADYTIPDTVYAYGSYKRFFVQSAVTGEVFEIGPVTHRELVRKSDKYHWPSYTIVELEWKVAGDVADKEINGYLVEGVESLNRRAVEEASKVIPEIQNLLIDYLEYHR